MDCKTSLFTDKIKLLFWGIYYNNKKTSLIDIL